MSPAWARGFDLAYLEEAAEVFTRAHKQHVYGAFGLVKERDIALAKSGGGFFCIQTAGKTRAAAIGHHLSRESVHRDYAGRALTIPQGSLYLKSIAGANIEHVTNLLKPFLLHGLPITIEIFEEDEAVKLAVTLLGFQYLGTKVSAGGEIKALYSIRRLYYTSYPKEPTLKQVAHQFITDKELVQIRAELSVCEEYFTQHYSNYNKRKSWSAFSLRGFRPADPTFIIKPAEMSKGWKEEHKGWERWYCERTPIAKQFPTVWEIIDRIPRQGIERVRFMRLAEKKGELSRHADITDRAAGLAPGKIARLHIPIYTSKAVKFRAWDERGQFMEEIMSPGSLWYLDTRKPHSVVNEGDVVRVHLVVDVQCNEETVKWVCRKK